MDDDTVGCIPEFDVLKGDLTGRIGEFGSFAALVFHLLGFQEVEYPSRCSSSRLDIGHGLCDLGKGIGEQPDVYHKRDDDTESDAAVHRQQCTDDADGYIPEVADKAHNRHHQSRQELGFPACLIEFFIELLEFFGKLLFSVAHPDDGMTGVCFLDMAVHITQSLLTCDKVLLGASHNQHHQHKTDQRRNNRRNGHNPVGFKHHQQASDQQHDRRNQRDNAVLDGLGDGVDVVGDTRKDITKGGFVIVIDGQPVDLFADGFPQSLRNPLGGDGHQLPLGKGQQRRTEVHNRQQHCNSCDRVHINAGHQSFGNQVGEFRQFIRSDNRKDGSADCADQRDDNGWNVFFTEKVQLFQPGGREFTLWHGCSMMHIHLLSSSFESCEAAIC